MTDHPTDTLLLTPRAGDYRVILVDPPWHFSGGKKGRPQHYPRMSDSELRELDPWGIANQDGCWLFMWSTSPKTADAFALAREWGFKYSGRGFLWAKTLRSDPTKWHLGMGYTTRKNAEDCWLFKSGKPKRLSKSVAELIVSPIREHSRKPDEVYDRIEAFAPGPYLEMFARQQRPGWDAWGNDTAHFPATKETT